MSSTLEGPVIPSSVWFFTQGVHFNRSFVWFNMKGPLWGVQPFKRGYGSKNIIFISHFWSLEPAVGGPVTLFQYSFLSRESIFNRSSTYIQMGANKRSRSSKTSIVFQKKISFFWNSGSIGKNHIFQLGGPVYQFFCLKSLQTSGMDPLDLF